jgi:hypothetical protein
MNDWNNYSWIKKIILGLVITLLAFTSPELMLLIDVGGIEMALSFLLFYYKPLINWFQNRIDIFEQYGLILKHITLNSSLMKPKVFLTHSIYSLVAMWFTGAIIFSMGFMLAALFVSGVNI